MGVGIPVRLRCWTCGTDDQLRGSKIPPLTLSTGTSEHVFGQCLKKAADCRRRAIQTRNDSLHDVLLRMELCWLRLGEQLNDGAAIVAASDASFRMRPETPAACFHAQSWLSSHVQPPPSTRNG